MNVAVSRHSKKRCKERMGLSKSDTQKLAEKAMTEGISYYTARGSLKRYISYIYQKNKKATNIRVYNQKVFVFTYNNVLITILDLPQQFHKYINKSSLQKN